MENKSEGFSYTYSARDQAEVKKIREKYLEPEQTEDKLELLRKLDAGVTQKGTLAALILGILGALVMGCGMSLVMTELYQLLGMGQTTALIVGICVGLVGMIGVALAYPIYNAITQKEKNRIAPQILALTEELLDR